MPRFNTTHVDVVRPGRALVTGPSGPGRPERERLTRHYGTDPGPIEISYERDDNGVWSGGR